METKFLLLFAFFLLYSSILPGQCVQPSALQTQDGNSIRTVISNGGDLFWDGDEGQFIVPVDEELPKSTFFAVGLWMGGFDAEGSLKLAAQTFGRSSGSFDYTSGPLNPDGTINEANCENFNKIWKVNKADIEAHKADFADNGVIDHPIDSIFKWPGKGNLSFYFYNSFPLPDMTSDYAPFYDFNGDGIYNPDQGDYPHPPNTIPEFTPASINWTVFNDNTIHTQTNGIPIKAEVQLTTWSFDCFQNPQLDRSVYTRHRIINKSNEALDSFHVALWADFDLGCFTDDFMGSVPEQNAFFVHNSDDLDGESSPLDCQGLNTYAYDLPVQSAQFLNREMDYFMYFNNQANWPPPIGNGFPEIAQQFYNYMTGSFADGVRLTYGNDGYDPNSTDYVNHAFPDNPYDPLGWSMKQAFSFDADRKVIGSTKIGHFEPGEVVDIDMAYTFHRYSFSNNQQHLINQMYSDIERVKQMYDMQFNSWCGIITDVQEIEPSRIEIFPNPSTGIFNLKTDNTNIDGLKLYDVSGKLQWQYNKQVPDSMLLEFGYLNNGIYVLRLETDRGIFNKKVVIQK